MPVYRHPFAPIYKLVTSNHPLPKYTSFGYNPKIILDYIHYSEFFHKFGLSTNYAL
ncbi:hypothetical protein SAMN04487911_105121 [Arenibacter nanhaiticus]|uniref:Uncharacterized protein n=1 Tax=Arenibacter nanhaiticus TaxID=558155 RepID=A0A1M6DSL7_9FLAO|nr:hypothetical protein SAMN04487911_105121 [Arenibacter nanhaiticus]